MVNLYCEANGKIVGPIRSLKLVESAGRSPLGSIGRASDRYPEVASSNPAWPLHSFSVGLTV